LGVIQGSQRVGPKLGRQKCIPAVIIQVEIPGITGDFVDASLNGQHHPFKIELRWLHPEGFADIFKKKLE
jgi:hypothetical protein